MNRAYESKSHNRETRVYFSTFIPGFESLIEEQLHQKKDVEILRVLNGAILYQSNAEEQIRQLKFFNNTFLVLASTENRTNSLDDLIDLALKNLDARHLDLPKSARTFRLITSEENRMITLDQKLFRKLSATIAKTTGLRVTTISPSLEFWLILRKEGLGILGLRLTTRRWSIKTRAKGSLPNELAHLLCLLSEPRKSDVFLDSFAGSGSIPLERYFLKGYQTILAADIDPTTVSKMSQRFIKNSAPLIKTKQADALNLQDIATDSIDKVVTDPPWGLYQKINDLDNFYRQMLAEFARALKKGGIAVILLPRSVQIETLLPKNSLQLRQKLDILHAGHKATVYQLTKV